MCGLAGVLAPSGEGRSLAELAAAMAETLAHRGPDGAGVWAEGPVALGHRRLAVLDLSAAGAQPMVSASGRYVLVHNGEIYNHLELRRELERAGAAPPWRGHADTETLLAAIECWGIDRALERAFGMFALALWDRWERRLFLARDRMGEKPLYWGWAGRDLVFASELKALRRHSEFAGEICRQALGQFFTFAYVPAPRTIYPSVFKLEPGCLLEVAQSPPPPRREPLRPGERWGRLAIRRYWSLAELFEGACKERFADPVEAEQAVEAALARAVARQRLADVPLGAFLSGGIDSSLLVALLRRSSSVPVRTFTIGFENPAFDESRHAEAVARHLGAEHQTLVVTEAEAREVIPRLPELYDEPFADSSQIPTHLVCRAARAQVTVALSGDGGDELFGGYNRYLAGPWLWRRIAWLPAGARAWCGRLLAAVGEETWDRLWRFAPARLAFARPGEKVLRVADCLRRARSFGDLYVDLTAVWPEGGEFLVGAAEPPPLLADPVPSCFAGDPAGWMMFQDLRTYLPDDLLCKVDRAAMGVSLETRAPFLDPEVLAVAARVPTAFKIRTGRGKWLLRRILRRHLPPALVERPKMGFSVPVGEWLRGPLRPWAEALLEPAELARNGLVDPAPVRRLWDEHLSGRRDWTHRLWAVLMWQAWRARWG
ncbi:MAG: asparagine synthetase B [Porticoccaceae bacterium]|nr:MAG: asparagine synthetase B [Porticoccaceae bacterium]